MGATNSHESDDGAPLAPRHPSGSGAGPPRRPGLGRRPTEAPGGSFSFEPLFPAATAAATMRPIECVSTLQKSGIVVNALSIAKNSLRLTPDAQDPHSLLLQFDFNAEVAGAVTVYYSARPVFRREEGSNAAHDARIVKMSFQSKSNRLPGRTPFEAGGKQRYRQNASRGLSLREYDAVELTEVVDNRYPLVVRLDAIYPSDSTVPLQRRVTSQTTYATLVPAVAPPSGQANAKLAANPVPRVEVVAQEVLIDGTVYRILDLYGIGPADVTVSGGADGSDVAVDALHECVICLTEPATYAVQPCNHLCLCDDCVRTLRFRGGEADPSQGRCPVCRTPIVRLFRIIPNSPDGLNDRSASLSVTDTSAPARPRPPSTETPRPDTEDETAVDGVQSFDDSVPSPGTVTAAVPGGAPSDEESTKRKSLDGD